MTDQATLDTLRADIYQRGLLAVRDSVERQKPGTFWLRAGELIQEDEKLHPDDPRPRIAGLLIADIGDAIDAELGQVCIRQLDTGHFAIVPQSATDVVIGVAWPELDFTRRRLDDYVIHRVELELRRWPAKQVSIALQYQLTGVLSAVPQFTGEWPNSVSEKTPLPRRFRMLMADLEQRRGSLRERWLREARDHRRTRIQMSQALAAGFDLEELLIPKGLLTDIEALRVSAIDREKKRRVKVERGQLWYATEAATEPGAY